MAMVNSPSLQPPPGEPLQVPNAGMQAVLFADVVGSTRLYEALGDAAAKKMIDECLLVMRDVIQRYAGRVVKTIGDEIMAVLPSADNACLASTDIHHKVMAMPPVSHIKRSVRIGFHYGAVIEENLDVFGDTVNVAARMAGLAKGMQIITTSATVAFMTPVLRLSTRPIAALSVKGKGEEVAVSEVIWQGGEELTMSTASISNVAASVTLELRHGARQWELDSDSLVLGRDAQCQVVIANRNASRLHARIERRRDKVFLIDQSTNGTYIAFAGESEVLLRREEIMLRGQGHIGCGHSTLTPDAEVVHFRLRP